MELIHLSDGDNSFRIHVRGRHMPGVLPLHDLLDTEVVIDSGFVSGRLHLTLRPDDLDAWSGALDVLATGGDASWMDDRRAPTCGDAEPRPADLPDGHTTPSALTFELLEASRCPRAQP